MRLLLPTVLLVLPLAAAADFSWRDLFPGSTTVSINGETPVEGSGHPATETRTVAPFHSVELRSSEDLVLNIGSETRVQVSGDDNLVGFIETRVAGDTLIVDVRHSYRSHTPLRVQVQLPSLAALTVSGSGDAQLTGLKESALKLSVDGSGDVKASGSAQKLSVELNGSGDLDLAGLAADTAVVEVNGSGDVDVQVKSTLKASVNGSGDIHYRGDATVMREVNGSGSVSRR